VPVSKYAFVGALAEVDVCVDTLFAPSMGKLAGLFFESGVQLFAQLRRFKVTVRGDSVRNGNRQHLVLPP
jgi:hypothetical protein